MISRRVIGIALLLAFLAGASYWLLQHFLATPTNARVDMKSVDSPRKNDEVPKQTLNSKNNHPVLQDLSSVNLARDSAKLFSIARTDPNFSYQLALRLLECRRVDSSYESISEVNDSGTLDPHTVEKMADAADIKANECKGLSRDQLDSYATLIEFAAESGVVAAQLAYSDALAETILSPESIAKPEKIVEYKKKSIDYFMRAALAGEDQALFRLGSAYQDGILVKQDNFSAYKYLYAYGRAHSGGRTNKLLSLAAAKLSATQQARAMREGSDLYSKCCRK